MASGRRRRRRASARENPDEAQKSLARAPRAHSTASRDASGTLAVPLIVTSSLVKTHSNVRVSAKSKPCLGLPRTITTVASPSIFFTLVNATRAALVSATASPVTSKSATRASAHFVCVRSSHVPAVFQELKPEPPEPSSFAESAAASASESFTGRAAGAVPRFAWSWK